MPRSVVITGLIQQRDRAQTRRRLDRNRLKDEIELDYRDLLKVWIYENITTKTITDVEAIDTKQFLYETNHIKLNSGERLRQLAIFLEGELILSEKQPRNWLAIDRIYSAALKHSSDDVNIHNSRAITAYECCFSVEHELKDEERKSKLRERMMTVAYESINKSLNINPKNVETRYLQGYLKYNDVSSSVQEALVCFEKTIQLNSKHNWALLYRGHCLQDLERWQEAVDAYNQVSPSFFVGPRSWRYECLLEQRAYCLYKAGQELKAVNELEALLSRWEQNVHLAKEAVVIYVKELALGLSDMREDLLEKTKALFPDHFDIDVK